MLYLILLVFAFVFAIIAALISVRPTPPTPVYFGWVHWGWLSFAFFLAALLFGPGGPVTHLGKLSEWIIITGVG